MTGAFVNDTHRIAVSLCAVGTLAARSTAGGCVWRNVKPPLMAEKPVTETRPHSLAAVRVHLGERSFKWKVENAHPWPVFTPQWPNWLRRLQATCSAPIGERREPIILRVRVPSGVIIYRRRYEQVQSGR